MVPLTVDDPRGRRLDDIEKAKEQKGESLPHWICTDEKQHQHESDHFVADDCAVIGDAEIAPGTVGRPDSDDES